MSKMAAQRTEEIQHLAAQFLVREASPQSLITVTRVTQNEDMTFATIFLSVMPVSEEVKALSFAKRERSALRDFVKKHSVFQPIPTFDFELDFGEKNRQRIDELTRK